MSSPATPSGGVRRLGRYTILEALAKGGMAQVFIAQKDNAPEICVLKQLLGELETHATAGKRFYREAHVASYLDHPRIARTIDAGFEDGAFCIAMEFIAGRDVESLMHLLMRQGRMLPYELSLAVALGVLEGLEYAHEAKDPSGVPLDLVHRDLSPRNVMLSFDGEVKIIDFGLARGKVDDFKTAPGMILGTLRYVSPEQAVADPVDARSDLYSIAVVLYEMLSGRPLVRDGKALDVLTDVVQRIPEPITVRNPHLPASLDPVLARALAKDPNERYQTARELRRALETAAGSLARTPKGSIGEFVTSLFPQERDKALARLELGRRRHAELSGGRGASQIGQQTLAGELELLSEDAGSRTRTGFMDAGALSDAHASETRTGWVAPAGMTALDQRLATRTVVEPSFLDPSLSRGGPSATTYDDPLPLPRELFDTTAMTPFAGDRTAAVDLGSRTLVYPPAHTPIPPPAPPASGPPLVWYAMGAVGLLGAAVIAAVLFTQAPEDVHVIAADRVPPPLAADIVPGARVGNPGPAQAVPAQAVVVPERSPESRRPPSPEGVGSKRPVPTSPRMPEATARPTATPAGTSAPAPGGAGPARLGAIRGDVERLRREWDQLDDRVRYDRFSALVNRLVEACPDEATQKQIGHLIRLDRLENDADADLGRLLKALSLIEKAGPR